MRAALRLLWRNHPWLTGAFLLALAATMFFAIRMTVFWVYWSDPAHQNQAIAGWMTPGYIAASWDIPREEMTEILQLAPFSGHPPSLRDLAQERGVSLPDLIAEIETAIAAYRDSND